MTPTADLMKLVEKLPSFETLDAVDDDAHSGRRPCSLDNFTIADFRLLRAALPAIREAVVGEFRELVEKVAWLERENFVLSYERERWSAAYNKAVKLLVGIHAVIYPMVVKLDDGREMRFNSPHLHEQMQAISDRIRAIPDELAALTEQENRNG